MEVLFHIPPKLLDDKIKRLLREQLNFLYRSSFFILEKNILLSKPFIHSISLFKFVFLKIPKCFLILFSQQFFLSVYTQMTTTLPSLKRTLSPYQLSYLSIPKQPLSSRKILDKSFFSFYIVLKRTIFS